MNDETRMALPIEMDVLKLTARMNELEYQLEVVKLSLKPLMHYSDRIEIDELKVLINPNLFEDVYPVEAINE